MAIERKHVVLLVGIRIHVKGGREHPAIALAQEAMIAQVIVAVADQHIEQDPAVQLLELRSDPNDNASK